MTIYPSTSAWNPIELPILREIELTTDGRELSRAHWPTWAKRSTQVNRILVYSHAADSSLRPASLSTGILVDLLTERIDLKDVPKIYNYNFYVIAESTDGRLFQSPPIRTTDPAHHSTSPSTWFDCLGTPL